MRRNLSHYGSRSLRWLVNHWRLNLSGVVGWLAPMGMRRRTWRPLKRFMRRAGNPKSRLRLNQMERFWRPVTLADLRLNASPIRRCVIRFLHYAQYWLPPHPDSRLKRLTDVCETPKRAWFSLNVGISLFLCTQAIDGSN